MFFAFVMWWSRVPLVLGAGFGETGTRAETLDIGEDIMRTRYTVVLSMLAGAALGAFAVQGLRAQAKPPVYLVSEIEVLDSAAYLKEYAPRARASIQQHGGRFVALGGKTTAIEGEPPKPRIAIIAWDSIDTLQAYWNSGEFKDIKSVRDKYSKFRSFAVEGLAN